MRLLHTLLFMLRENSLATDLPLAQSCLKSLEKSSYKGVIVFNQGFWSNAQLAEFLNQFDLDCTIIGNGENMGTTVGRQSCFKWAWENCPQTEMLSELHLDMVFVPNWEDPLVAYLDTHDEPLISCGIVDQNGAMPYLDRQAPLPPAQATDMNVYLPSLACDSVVDGFTNPCIHQSKILQQAGGYDAAFLTGKHAFEDDSMLLGYYYYYGTRAKWQPKVCYQSVVYHKVAGQRFVESSGDVMVNYHGLVRQYGAMGLKQLSEMKRTDWQNHYFAQKYTEMRAQR